MIRTNPISLQKLILSLSDALDYVCPEIADHQQRVTYIAMHMARRLGFENRDLADLFLASALHDVGMIRAKSRIAALRDGNIAAAHWHGETGYELLRSNDLFARAARIIRHHHRPWNESPADEDSTERLSSQIIFLADSVERIIDRKANILEQSARIVQRVEERSGGDFDPRCVDALRASAGTEAFWLDCVSDKIYEMLLLGMNEPPVDATDDTIQGIAEMFARVVDAMSGWTATHTAGVAATAVALAKLMKFSLREQIFMRTAGLLHDLGKLSVPTSILDKRGDLSPQEWVVIKGHTYHTYKILDTVGFPRQIAEWAAFHHERIDGNGYPFHLKGRYLTLGSRIMAVADTFTALTEDRPYRSGVSCTRAITIMHRQARNGGLDGDVLAVLAKNRDYVDTIRRREQERYARDQRRLAAMIPEEPELQKAH